MEYSVNQQPARKKLKMDPDLVSEENLQDSQDLFAGQDLCDNNQGLKPDTEKWIEAGLEIEKVPRTGISVGSQFPGVEPTSRPSSKHPGTTDQETSQYVLVDLFSLREGSVPSPYPKQAVDKWDSWHVRLPWSPESKYFVTVDGNKTLEPRWQVIQQSLSTLLSLDLTQDSKVLAASIRKAVLKYNQRFEENSLWTFVSLEDFLENLDEDSERETFYSKILPGMVRLCLEGPEAITGVIPLLVADKRRSITLSQHQISVLLANAFFCTFPRRNSVNKENFEYKNYPDINFSRLFSKVGKRPEAIKEKIKTLLAYFRRVIDEKPTGLVTYTRQVVKPGKLPDWKRMDVRIPGDHVRLTSTGVIEKEGQGMLQADFANKIIGGGVIGQGCVQEEIRFIICPELLISRLFTEKLDDNEVVFIHGAEQYSNYTGYADSYKWAGMHKDTTGRDLHMRRNTTVLAMDATSFKHFRGGPQNQYELNYMLRELNKAFIGFLPLNQNVTKLNAVATGNWGCGAFGGDPEFKFLLQLLASVVAGRKLCYFTFGSNSLVKGGWKVYELCVQKNVSVSKLFTILSAYIDRRNKRMTVFQFVELKLNDSPKKLFAVNENKSNGHANEAKCDKYDQLTDDEGETIPVKDYREREKNAPTRIQLVETDCNKDSKTITNGNNREDKILNLYKNYQQNPDETETLTSDESNHIETKDDSERDDSTRHDSEEGVITVVDETDSFEIVNEKVQDKVENTSKNSTKTPSKSPNPNQKKITDFFNKS